MAWRRNIFTGELEQVPDGPGGRQILYRSPDAAKTPRRRGDPWDRGRDHISRPLSLLPENATPENIAHENEEARRHGTGAWFDAQGLCHLPTRGSRRREMSRVRSNGMCYRDNDGCYGDG